VLDPLLVQLLEQAAQARIHFAPVRPGCRFTALIGEVSQLRCDRSGPAATPPPCLALKK
jgi:hypothetical protein